MNRHEYMQLHRDLCDKMVSITEKKNADYAGAGDDPFSNFRQIGSLIGNPNAVEIGFLTRMSDKLSRIGSFVTNGELQVKDESVEDTLLDLANYSLLFIGYLRDKNGSLKVREAAKEFTAMAQEKINQEIKQGEIYKPEAVEKFEERVCMPEVESPYESPYKDGEPYRPKYKKYKKRDIDFNAED